MHTRTLRLLLTLLACASAQVSARAQATLYWNPTGSTLQQGGSGTLDTTSALWNTSTSPSDTLVAFNPGDTGVFGGTGGTITASGTFSAEKFDFQAAYTLAGSLTLSQGYLYVTNGNLALTGSLDITSSDNTSDTVSNVGTLTVNGGTLNSAAKLYFGLDSSSNAHFNISNGGTASYVTTMLGVFAGSYGFSTVSGASSTLASSTLILGENGYGQLTVSNGGSAVTYGTIFLGNVGASSTGYLTVTGTGSTLTTTAPSIYVGVAGSGTLSLADGGIATVDGGAGEIMLGSSSSGSGTLRIGEGGAAGHLQAANVSTGFGTGEVIFNHSDTAYTFTPLISGSAALLHEGTGTTVLGGANTYTGGTTVTAGTLKLGNYNAFGTGDITLGGGTLEMGGFSHTNGTGTLTVADNSFLVFSGASESLAFADSSALTWDGALTILGFTENDSLRFGTDANGLTSGQLALINFDGSPAMIDASGYVTAAVPEPSTYALLAGLGALGLAAIRRRRCLN